MNNLRPKLNLSINQKGLSLFEILIAISVLAMMMLGVIQFTQTSFDTTERVTREDSEALQIETAMSRLEWDFSQIFSPLYFDHLMDPKQMSELEQSVYNEMSLALTSNARFKKVSFTGQPVPLVEREDKSTLSFFTSSNRRKIENSKQSNFSWVRYSLTANDEKIEDNLEQKGAKERKPTQMLIRQVYHKDIYGEEAIEWDRVKEQVLHRKIVKLVFEFWDPKKFKWTENLKVIKDGEYIIHALRASIEFLNADNMPEYTVRIFRPLFPVFKPEDMYKFLNEEVKKSNTTNTSNSTSNSEGQSSQTDDQGTNE